MTLSARSTMRALAAFAFAMSGCLEASTRPPIRPPGRTPSPGIPDGAVPERPDSETRALGGKRVASKREISTLVADDGTLCTVSEKRYRDTKVGDHVWCVWVDADG